MKTELKNCDQRLFSRESILWHFGKFVRDVAVIWIFSETYSPVLSILNYAPYVIYEIKKFTKIRFKKFDLLEIKREIIYIVS